jgi:hypothetical protein
MIPEAMAEKKAPKAMPEVPAQGLGEMSFSPIPKGQPAERPMVKGFSVSDTDGLVDVGNLL